MSRSSDQPYDYDGALSFAGTERRYALALARAMKRLGLKPFYDRDESALLWGKDSKVYERIYGPASRFVLAFISEEYRSRDWTRFEFACARREAKRRGSEFILPIRVDDTPLFGLHEDNNYLSLKEFSPTQIAKKLKEKIDAISGAKNKRHSSAKPTKTVRVLTRNQRHALGILTFAPVPLPRVHFESLFP
jgi:hypothetical protein